MDPMIDPKWNERPKSRLVRVIQQEACLTSQELADALGISVPYLNNKLNRNSFSFEDLIKIANKAGYDLYFCKQHYEEGNPADPATDPKDEEIAKLRKENENLRRKLLDGNKSIAIYVLGRWGHQFPRRR